MKRIQNFIKLNNLNLNDFISLISTSKIILSKDDNRVLYNEGDDQLGFYILIKGSLLVKISKLSMPYNIDIFFKKDILQEYNLENDTKILWLKADEIKEYKNKTIKHKYIFLSDSKMTNISPSSSIFQKRHEERIKASAKVKKVNFNYEEKDSSFLINNEEIELFIYNLGPNDTLFFGGVNFFNEYIRESPQIHLTSAYLFNNKLSYEKDYNNENNFILYISEDKVKELFKKISLLNKERTKFLLNKLTPLNALNSENIRFFISTINMVYIDGEKDLINSKNIFYLVYQGSCWEKKKKEIIYDQGSFICLNNVFFKEINLIEKTTFYSKGSYCILFKIDLNYLSENNKLNMKTFLENIFASQYIARVVYRNKIQSYENKKIKEKEKAEENEFKNFIISNNNSLLNKTQKDFYSNNKSLNKVYLNKNIYIGINSPKILAPIKGKKIRYFLKKESKPNASSVHSSNNNIPLVKSFYNSENISTINNHQNPINKICLKNYNCSTDRVEFGKTKKDISIKNKNDIFTINNYNFNSFYSSRSYSYYNNNNKKRMKKKNKFNKNMILRNIKIVNIKGNNMAVLHNQATD